MRVDVDRSRARCFGLAEDVRELDARWHRHRKHQLLYAVRGSMRLWVEDAMWLLPPGRAAWLPAGARHRVTSGPLSLRTVYLHPELIGGFPAQTSVFTVDSLAAEMIQHAMRWGPRHRITPLSRAFFETFARLCLEWTESSLPLRLPVARSEALQVAMDWTLVNLERHPTAARAARAAALSPRTLARRFAEETKTTWRRYLHDARMIEAAHRLGLPAATVGEVANALGFESVSAFSRAFKAFTGQTPRQMLARHPAPQRN
ncbi:MAG: AraC family transcriptional regulator [Nannocystales bacterium]